MLLNVRETDDKKVYVSSDFHLGHKGPESNPVWKQRGFADVPSHDDAVIDSVNAMVRPNDILIFLGDFCLNTTLAQFDVYLDRIKCQNVMALWGNHPNPHYKGVYLPMVKKLLGENYTPESEVYPLKYKNMTYYGTDMEMIINGQYVVLSHFPVYVWHECQHGAWMLCGHSHYGCELSKATGEHGKILDVGWDSIRKPWSMDEIRKVMEVKRLPYVDHHQK